MVNVPVPPERVFDDKAVVWRHEREIAGKTYRRHRRPCHSDADHLGTERFLFIQEENRGKSSRKRLILFVQMSASWQNRIFPRDRTARKFAHLCSILSNTIYPRR